MGVGPSNSLTFFFSNFGPNSTTFMLPSLTFPDQVRGSLNGISAASGKFKSHYEGGWMSRVKHISLRVWQLFQEAALEM